MFRLPSPPSHLEHFIAPSSHLTSCDLTRNSFLFIFKDFIVSSHSSALAIHGGVGATIDLSTDPSLDRAHVWHQPQGMGVVSQFKRQSCTQAVRQPTCQIIPYLFFSEAANSLAATTETGSSNHDGHDWHPFQSRGSFLALGRPP